MFKPEPFVRLNFAVSRSAVTEGEKVVNFIYQCKLCAVLGVRLLFSIFLTGVCEN